jgi:integrase/recombinase XerD
MKTPTESWLSPLICRYLDLKQALGRGFANERRVLETLAEFVATAAAADLTQSEFEHWCKTQTHLTTGVRRNRMRIVRNFCLYRRRTEPHCFVPDLDCFPHPHQPVQPYIFSETEIVHLLQASELMHPVARCPLRRQFFRLAIVLLYTTGLRRRELLRLALQDYDPQTYTLLVRESKFHKSRYLPLSPDASRELEAYLDARRQHPFPRREDSPPLLWNGYANGRTYTACGLTNGLQELLRAAGIRKADGRLPRVHDFRHAFACRVLLRWYRTGVDLQTKLPFLATYMGHVSIASTEYYLPFIPELALAANNRFCGRYGALVQPLSQGGVS